MTKMIKAKSRKSTKKYLKKYEKLQSLLKYSNPQQRAIFLDVLIGEAKINGRAFVVNTMNKILKRYGL